MKTTAVLFAALILGFMGGIAGYRFSVWKITLDELMPSGRARSFELVDRAGQVVSVWTTDQWGRPILVFNDAKWEGRIMIGPLDQANTDVAAKHAPDSNAAWGILVTAPSHAAHAVLGTRTDVNTKTPTGFADWR